MYISELILLLRRLHEAFIAIAAQLQQVHEAVKVLVYFQNILVLPSINIFQSGILLT